MFNNDLKQDETMSLDIWKLSDVKSIKYKEPELEQLIKQFKIRGSGIKGDPYLFDNTDRYLKLKGI